jgi:hypothetical protein
MIQLHPMALRTNVGQQTTSWQMFQNLFYIVFEFEKDQNLASNEQSSPFFSSSYLTSRSLNISETCDFSVTVCMTKRVMIVAKSRKHVM